jgi:Ni/Co efflux regulator RcnB
MKRSMTSIALAMVAGSLTFGSAAFAAPDHRDDRHDSHYHSHPEWKKGGRIQHSDWDRGHKVDYRAHHLRQPPRGYEWREVDGNYVLAAVATGLIASIILSNN